MGTVLTLLALALAAGASLSHGREAAARWILTGVAAAALAPLGLGLLGCSSKLDLRQFEEIAGYRLGKMVLEAVDGEGPILVLRRPSDLRSDEPTASRFRGLREACSDWALIEAGPDPLALGPPYDAFYIFPGEDWASRVAEWCRQHPDAVAVVSLLFEFPPLEDSWDDDLPPLYGFTAGPSRAWAELMRDGWLEAVIRYRDGGPRDATLPKRSPEEAFDHYFELVTPETLRDAMASGG